MNKMKIMNLEQLKEVTGGLYHGRLDKDECEALAAFGRLYKSYGYSMERYVNAIKDNHDRERKEYVEAAVKYVQTFWDRF